MTRLMTIRTTVSIDEDLLRRAKRLAQTSSPSAVVNLALAALIREAKRRELLEWIDRGEMNLTPAELRKLRKSRSGEGTR